MYSEEFHCWQWMISLGTWLWGKFVGKVVYYCHLSSNFLIPHLTQTCMMNITVNSSHIQTQLCDKEHFLSTKIALKYRYSRHTFYHLLDCGPDCYLTEDSQHHWRKETHNRQYIYIHILFHTVQYTVIQEDKCVVKLQQSVNTIIFHWNLSNDFDHYLECTHNYSGKSPGLGRCQGGNERKFQDSYLVIHVVPSTPWSTKYGISTGI